MRHWHLISRRRRRRHTTRRGSGFPGASAYRSGRQWRYRSHQTPWSLSPLYHFRWSYMWVRSVRHVACHGLCRGSIRKVSHPSLAQFLGIAGATDRTTPLTRGRACSSGSRDVPVQLGHRWGLLQARRSGSQTRRKRRYSQARQGGLGRRRSFGRLRLSQDFWASFPGCQRHTGIPDVTALPRLGHTHRDLSSAATFVTDSVANLKESRAQQISPFLRR